jgi:hypothetical protein
VKATLSLVVLLANLIQAPTTLTPQNGASSVTSKDKKVAWNSQWEMEEIRLQGKRAVRFTEQGSGRLSSYSEEVHWSVQSTWMADDGFRPLSTEKTITSSDGKLLIVERKQFDRDKGNVRFERKRTGQPTETTTIDVPEDTLAIEGLAGVLRFANVPKVRSLPAHILTNEPKVYDVTFEWRDEESVKTPAGEFHCYKVEVVPHLGVLNLFRPFLPKTYFWFTVASPHNWVRYEGPENGPGTPEVVMSLSETRR